MHFQKISFLKLLFVYFLSVFVTLNTIQAQLCNGSWTLQRPATTQCVVGQWIGWQNMTEPPGCPIDPTYTGVQINTFTFAARVSNFSIDFKGLDGNPECARIQIKINGIFYPLTNLNISDFPVGSTCTTGSFSYVKVTPDGYLTNSLSGGQSRIAQGRITISGVNAESLTISTNDGFGTVFSDPFNCLEIVPVKLKNFKGRVMAKCRVELKWNTETEINTYNFVLERSYDGIVFKRLIEVIAKGNNSQYLVITDNLSDEYFRLKINDLDGNYQYSEILHLKSSCKKSEYTVWPNPVYNTINIEGLANNDQLLLLDIRGKFITRFNFHQNNKYNVQPLASGIYFLQVLNMGMIKHTLKVIKR